MTKLQEEIKNILIIRLSSLGDVLLTTPVVRALKKKYEKAEIDFLVKPQYSDAVKYNAYLREVIEYSVSNPKETIKLLKQKKYDLVVDLQNNLRSGKIRKSLKIKSYVFHKPNFEKFMLVHFKKNYFGGVFPIPFRYAQSIKGLTLDEEGLDLFLPHEIKPELKEGKNYIGFCPGSKHFTKMYPAEYFIELGKMLRAEGFEIVIFGGKDDTDVCRKVSEGIPDSINLCNANELLKTAVNIKLCKAVICNDSGLMHTAAAVKIPVIAIFGSTVKEFGFVPFGVKNIILENNSLSCRPCSHIGRDKCPKKHFDCMRKLTPGWVFENTMNFLKEL
jgi:ADP-heptose:LPS heptosyltransferase